jgi:dihydrofolate reductase
VSYVVARSWPDSIIGRNNELPWHLSTDLRRFKELTWGHPIIMGRKTHLSIGRLLPGRANIVLSRRSDGDLKNTLWRHDQTMLIWAENRESALYFGDVLAISQSRPDLFVIGGAEMYKIFEDLFNKVYLTEVMTGDVLNRKPTDALFEYKIDNRKWTTLESLNIPAGPKDDFPSKYTVLERRMKRVRYIQVNDYYTEVESKKKWLEEQLELFGEISLTSRTGPIKVPHQFELFEEEAR